MLGCARRSRNTQTLSLHMRTILALSGLLLLPACAPTPPPTNQPSNQAAACAGYADLATARTTDGRLLLQAFDSAARTVASNPRQVGRTAARGPSAEDTTTNRLLGVQVTSPPYLDSPARVAMAREILKAYPPDLRQARLGGSLLLVGLVDTQGRVRQTRIATSSGYRTMDQAAANVLRRARFEPATAGGCRVPYVLPFPISFTP